MSLGCTLRLAGTADCYARIAVVEGVVSGDGQQDGRVRGTICHGFLDFLQQQLGVEEIARRLGGTLGLPEFEGLEVRRPGIGFLPSRWYGASMVHQLLDLVLGDLPQAQQRNLASMGGRFVFAQQLTGLQRALFALLLTPPRYVRHAQRAWTHNFGSGLVTFEVGERSHRTTYTSWVEHHPMICRAMMSGRLEVYAAMGKKDARVAVDCCSPETGCSSTVWWGQRSDEEPFVHDARADEPLPG